MSGPDWQLVLLVGCVAFSLAAGLGTLHLWLRLKRMTDSQTHLIDGLQRDLAGMCNAASRAGDRLARIERQLPALIERQDQVEMRAPSTGRFRQAIALVHRGANTDDLMASCGLARGEAELLYLLHRSPRPQVEH